MKELTTQEQAPIEIVQEQNKTQQLIGSVRKIKGTELYVMNVKTGEIKIAKFVEVEYHVNSKENPQGKIGHKLVLEDEEFRNESVYFVQAINVRNARRKFKKYFLKKLK